ncbi:MAG: helix-turn-helix transcriptional regulator [Elusimicrobia bacterium]|nr:helix-turn-helix transcriptional regulator [Elusimicrobiota bacterium]
MKEIYRKLGENVRRQRENLGWTQEELGEKSGLHPSYIGQIERATKKVSLTTVERLASALGIKPGNLLDDKTASYKSSRWESRIGGILRDRSSNEKSILYSTLKQLARSLRKSKSRPG